jgi:hypothetical protein
MFILAAFLYDTLIGLLDIRDGIVFISILLKAEDLFTEMLIFITGISLIYMLKALTYAFISIFQLFIRISMIFLLLFLAFYLFITLSGVLVKLNQHLIEVVTKELIVDVTNYYPLAMFAFTLTFDLIITVIKQNFIYMLTLFNKIVNKYLYKLYICLS